MENIMLVSNIVLVIGFSMLIISIIMYIKRTGDKTALIRFWAFKSELSKLETNLNRGGLVTVIIGAILPSIF